MTEHGRGQVWKVETIGDCYKAVVGGPEPCADHAYRGVVLAYSIIMLTTNLHNPQVKAKEKMELHQFMRQNCDINDGTNFAGDFLEGVFDAIKAQQLQVMT